MERVSMSATIRAVETGDETIYVLDRPGLPPLTAYWPHPLELLAPNARRIETNWGASPPRSGLTVQHGRITRRAY
jgi:hypothetical protein